MVPLGAAPFSSDNAGRAGLRPPQCPSSASLDVPGSSPRYTRSGARDAGMHCLPAAAMAHPYGYGYGSRQGAQAAAALRQGLKPALEMENLLYGYDPSTSSSPSTMKEIKDGLPTLLLMVA